MDSFRQLIHEIIYAVVTGLSIQAGVRHKVLAQQHI
jgi:hypothetical protein